MLANRVVTGFGAKAGGSGCATPAGASRWVSVALALCLWVGAVGAESRVPEDCTNCGTITGSIVVQKASLRTKGAKHDRDVVLMLKQVGATCYPESDAQGKMDQQGLVFVPHVLAVQKGSTVTFLNSDNELHNVYFLDDETGDTLDIGTWGPGVSVDHKFDRAGLVITLCKLHLEMAAYIVVTESPWFTVVQLDPETSRGAFEMGGLPPGEYELSIWHKKLKQKGGVARVTVVSKGSTEVEVVITKAKYAGKSP